MKSQQGNCSLQESVVSCLLLLQKVVLVGVQLLWPMGISACTVFPVYLSVNSQNRGAVGLVGLPVV